MVLQLKGRADAVGLAHALKGANAYSTEVVKNEQGTTLDRVVTLLDEKAVAMDEDNDEDSEIEAP